jgi:hypothetical protein
MIRRAHPVACLAVGLVLAFAGCSKKLPQLTEAGGVVLLDNEPLPFACVQFMPELSEFGAEYNSTATTDKEGKFTLMCNKTGEPGAVIGSHRVIVFDSTPRNLRGQSEEAQLKYAEYYEQLKNRPIPLVYASVGKTPLRIEVTAQQKSYTLELTRPK